MPANDPPPFQIIGYQAFPMRQSNHRFSIGDFPDLLDTPDSIKYFSLSPSLSISLFHSLFFFSVQLLSGISKAVKMARVFDAAEGMI